MQDLYLVQDQSVSYKSFQSFLITGNYALDVELKSVWRKMSMSVYCKSHTNLSSTLQNSLTGFVCKKVPTVVYLLSGSTVLHCVFLNLYQCRCGRILRNIRLLWVRFLHAEGVRLWSSSIPWLIFLCNVLWRYDCCSLPLHEPLCEKRLTADYSSLIYCAAFRVRCGILEGETCCLNTVFYNVILLLVSEPTW